MYEGEEGTGLILQGRSREKAQREKTQLYREEFRHQAASTLQRNETLCGRAELYVKISHEDKNVLHVCFPAVLRGVVTTGPTWPVNTGNGAARPQELDVYFYIILTN